MDELATRLLADARKFVAPQRERSRLTPYRETILSYRAKYLSYDRIAVILTAQGISITGPGVAYYCRTHCRKADIDRARREMAAQMRGASTSSPALSTAPIPTRQPRIARDDL